MYQRHRFPSAVIQHAVWLHLRFTLSLRDVEELLAERGLDVSYETVRRWVIKFGPLIARNLRHHRPGHRHINRAERERSSSARRVSRGGSGKPCRCRFGSEDPEGGSRDKVTLAVEVVVDGGMHAEEPLC